uniref:PDZ domain-containing protein n=1 Tax=Hucho hucho TaxID=62062 RepID=A0A4W5RJZ5_9TELE
MSKSLKKKHHWTNKVYESVLCRNKEGELGFELKGGAENGQFPYLGEVRQGKVACQSGRLSQDELLLEVNETPVAGLTIRDVHAVVRHSKDPVRLKCVKQGEWTVSTTLLYGLFGVTICSLYSPTCPCIICKQYQETRLLNSNIH